MSEYLSDLEIANSANKKNIVEIADSISINKENLIRFGDDKAKLSHNLIKSLGKIVSNTKDKAIVSDVSHLLLDQARIVEGELPLDTKSFTDKLSSIITKSLLN